MSIYIEVLDKVTNSSAYTLKSSSFDRDNYHSDAGTGAHVSNLNFDADTPKGVLGGSVASLSVGGNNWEARDGAKNYRPIGLFSGNSEGNAFENAPAAASGKVGVYMNGGHFLVYAFETNEGAPSGSTPSITYASCLNSYAIGSPLYCSGEGLLTPVANTSDPSSVGYTTGSGAWYVGLCTKVPTASELELGVLLSIQYVA